LLPADGLLAAVQPLSDGLVRQDQPVAHDDVPLRNSGDVHFVVTMTMVSRAVWFSD